MGMLDFRDFGGGKMQLPSNSVDWAFFLSKSPCHFPNPPYLCRPSFSEQART
jgi:hypothetical protein